MLRPNRRQRPPRRMKRILFVCVENSNRSQMAEAFARAHGGGRVEAHSAGSRPSGSINPRAVHFMAERGIDLGAQRSKSLQDIGDEPFDAVVTMGCGDTCPWIPAARREDWALPDPKHLSDDRFRAVRDEIESRVQALLRELPADTRTGKPALGAFERWLSLWVALCILVGIGIGRLFPQAFQALGAIQIAHINLPIGVLIWLMIVPMLMRVDFGSLGAVRQHWRGFGVTLFVNWAVKPFSMALLGWIFIRHLFAQWLPPQQHDSYIAGLILLAAAPCTAMVFVWSQLVRGEANFTLTQVALNDTIMVFAFAPIVALLLGVAAIAVPWATLLLSVALYIVLPLALAQAVRIRLRRSPGALEAALRALHPLSLLALLATLVLLFGFQGEAILRQPLVIAMLAVPIVIQVVFNAALAYGLNRLSGEAHCVAGPSALIGASNFFELSVAAAIALFGFESGAALATVVGVLIEVPLMLVVVGVVNRSRVWYEATSDQRGK
ncbi:MAG: arsenical-resistance protein [Xanthomonadales bacterium PRO7]|nr:arsenical-resistance protein [Xanthomonadales bacterium PRO7]